MKRATLVAVALFAASSSFSDPLPDQQVFWWLDEVRTVAFSLSQARTGKIAQWPRMTVVPGSGTLPLPRAAANLELDGKLDQAAWAQATSFPVGPLFGPWPDGPLMLQVSVCYDDKSLHLLIESPRDLTDLGALTAPGELFSVAGQPFHVGKGGGLPDGAVRTQGQGQIIEVSIPLPTKDAQIPLVFVVELARRSGGKLPPETASLGLNKLSSGDPRHPRVDGIWLDPIALKLVPSAASVRLSCSVRSPREATLSHELREPGKPAKAAQTAIQAKNESGVLPYSWQAGPFRLDGFLYVEPIAETLRAARAIASRSAAPPSLAEVETLEKQAQVASPQGGAGILPASSVSAGGTPAPLDRPTWRQLYCRARELRSRAHLSLLDAPLLFVKQHPYFAAHIYDDFYPWHPGGGIYVLENPANPAPARKVHAVIDPKTQVSLGGGVYRDPDLYWDASKLLFVHKPGPSATTSIYEIGINGKNFRRLTKSDQFYDIWPAYLPNGRIVFNSTRPKGRVPCFDSGVATLHTMDPDGSDIRPISMNNVNEFNPTVLHDGRILYGRWEYVDKTALYIQSLWTLWPDGTNEAALFANNMCRPTALLDARAVPGSRLVVASLTPHNGQPAGAIGMISPDMGKNNLAAITNFTPEFPAEMDQGLTTAACDPWPLSKDDVLISNNAIAAHGIIELVSRDGCRELVHCDPEISCYAPMLVKPHPKPPVIAPMATPPSTAFVATSGSLVAGSASEPLAATSRGWGRFLILDIYEGLTGIPRGTIRRLRVIEETARTSEVPPGGRWWNQAFLISWQGAYVVKIILGVVPVYPDGSAYFEAPPGRALYFEALDEEGREIQRMRTFVHAAPGVTRSCIGCHEQKRTAPPQAGRVAMAVQRPPARIEPESWGSGYLDYASMVQPVLDRQCVRCHGGESGIEGGIDLSGGWTWAFNISYETLLKNSLTGFLRCENGDVRTADILPPLTLGSGAAPLAKLLIAGHDGLIQKLSRPERDLLLAWMDTNSNYYGTWDYTPHANCNAILGTRGPLAGAMQSAGCTKCHAPAHIGNDWVNLQRPEWSRILRAPLAVTSTGEPGAVGTRQGAVGSKEMTEGSQQEAVGRKQEKAVTGEGSGPSSLPTADRRLPTGLAWCRDRKAVPGMRLVDQGIMPPDVVRPAKREKPDRSGNPVVTFSSPADPRYQAMLAIIRQARAEAVSQPRVDMPGAIPNPGSCRHADSLPIPATPPPLKVAVAPDGAVELAWPHTAETIGLDFEVHRGPKPDFQPDAKTLVAETNWFQFTDSHAPAGPQTYALVLLSGEQRSKPIYTEVTVPTPPPPPAPKGLAARVGPGEVILQWEPPLPAALRYAVYRAKGDAATLDKLTKEPLAGTGFADGGLAAGVAYRYVVRAVDRRGQEGEASAPITATPLPEMKDPLFTAPFDEAADAKLLDGKTVKATLHGGAKLADRSLDLGKDGYATFAHLPEFDIRHRLSVEAWVRLDSHAGMPVILSCGAFTQAGWFLQLYQGRWRWHLGGVSCDGGTPPVGQWVHVVATFDGHRARVFQNGVKVADCDCVPNRALWPGPLIVGQYSGAVEGGFQVRGRIAGLRIYSRAISAEEAAAAFKAGRP